MTRKTLVLIATAGSVLLLGGAFFFQLIGWAPCKMCLWQRWPHAAAIAIGVVFLALPGRFLPLLGAAAAAVTAGIGLYHSGVERDWWDGPASCTSSGAGLGGLGGADLLPGAANAPGIVLCDAFNPFFAGLTMANWNFLISAVLVLVWLAAFRVRA